MSVMNTLRLVRQLDKLGFKREGDDYCRNGLRARFESGWLTIQTHQTQAANGGGPIRDASSAPGLWKTVCRPHDRLELVFDLPLATVTEQEVWDDETGDGLCPLDEMIAWASATSSGSLPAGWKSPPREELEESLPGNAFTLEIGPFARQGQLCCEVNRLSVSIPLLQRIPAELSPRRRACLDQLLADVQNRSRLVRLVESATSTEARSVLAEVDLSGAPQFAIPLLLRIGLDAVRHVVSQSISAVELLANPTVTSTVWEVPSGAGTSCRREAEMTSRQEPVRGAGRRRWRCPQPGIERRDRYPLGGSRQRSAQSSGRGSCPCGGKPVFASGQRSLVVAR